MKEEITDGLSYSTIEEIEDRSGEIIDSYLPVYNNRIIEEWQNMPSDYDNRGAAELGTGEDINIVNLMTLDLYLYYSDLFNDAIKELKEELNKILDQVTYHKIAETEAKMSDDVQKVSQKIPVLIYAG
jgi:hypothetical protein